MAHLLRDFARNGSGRIATVAKTAPVVIAATLCGCGESLVTNALPSVPQLGLPAAADKVVGSPTELYTRVARGILSCYFGADGPLKGRYVYHADAEPEGRGGKSEIVIHERDLTQQSPRALRAFRVVIAPEGEQTMIASENLKLPDAIGTQMKADVKRWAAGNVGCAEPGGEAKGWAPGAKEPTPATAARKAPAKRSSSVRPAASKQP